MVIGIPREVKVEEYRVAMVPAGVRALVQAGHQVRVQAGAGAGSGIMDEEYAVAGANMVSREDAWSSDMVVKVKEPIQEEFGFLREGMILFTYLHLAAAQDLAKELLANKVIAVAYETIQLAGGALPLLTPMSEVAGRMAVQAGARYLEIPSGGRGVLLGGVPGVHRGRVTIVGAGVVGTAALKIAVGMGAEVMILDVNQARLAYLDDVFGSRITTLISLPDSIHQAVVSSHLVIGAVLIPGAKAPRLVTEDMVRKMKPRTVLVDVSIDQGGCIETMRPTTHADPVYMHNEVIHYGVTNMPGAVGRTSTFALTNVTLPYVVALADKGPKAARLDPALAKGFNCYQGAVTHPGVASALEVRHQPLEGLLF